jgi:hypothetical protein
MDTATPLQTLSDTQVWHTPSALRKLAWGLSAGIWLCDLRYSSVLCASVPSLVGSWVLLACHIECRTGAIGEDLSVNEHKHTGMS